MARPKLDPTATPTRERILTAAEGAFAATGYEAKLADIATTAGIRRPSLLYHFASKDELFSAVIERAFARLGRALAAAMAAEGDPGERVDRLVGAYLAFLADVPQFAPLVLREVLDGRGPGRELILTYATPLLDALEAFLGEAGPADVPPRAAVLQIATAALVRKAAGPLERPLWGDAEHLPAIARALLHLPAGGSS